MPDVTSPRELAAKCRSLAEQIGDEQTRQSLLQLAAEYDKQADDALEATDPD